MQEVPLIPQPHGGAIQQGNPPPPGGWPGSGRPLNKFRELCRQVTADNLEPVMIPMIQGTLERDGQKPTFADSRQAYNDLAKLGWAEQVAIPGKEFQERVIACVLNTLELTPEQAESLAEAFAKEFSS